MGKSSTWPEASAEDIPLADLLSEGPVDEDRELDLGAVLSWICFLSRLTEHVRPLFCARLGKYNLTEAEEQQLRMQVYNSIVGYEFEKAVKQHTRELAAALIVDKEGSKAP